MSGRTPEAGTPVEALDSAGLPGAAGESGTAEEAAAQRESAGENEVPGDLRMTRLLWPFMLASAVGLVPFTIYSTFLVPIAHTAGGDVASLGQLRGLGGLAALAVGTALAPLIDRVRREHAAAGGLAALAVAAALGAGGDLLLLAAFCLLVGAATAVLNPALTAAAADCFENDAAAGRAATLVTATQSLTALLAAPLVAVPALLWGWQGDLWAIAAICCALALYFLLRTRRRGAGEGPEAARSPERPGYLESFRLLGALPGVVPLLLIAMLRTAAFMGYLAYLAAFYDERFGLGPGMFAMVWTLSGTSFFLGNLYAGRLLSAERQRVRAEPLMALALLLATVAVVGVFFTGSLLPALLLTALVGVGHAVVAACVTTLLVRRCGSLRGTALSVNAAGMSFGVFLGAGLGGVGLALGGHPGTAAALGGLTLAALVLARTVARSAPATHVG
ncbi:MFS transporter [Streptomyces sp. P38-E01]|uniref:MFS transporter n=1 Tax=Streptomyces tardus TaxID=2780544 RepID=A0A949NAQ6_9ACTN|nr:MFS transporter [Streptomyces tardus]MBU7600108.1 MFS transporter [Streptomyces tardus]